MNLLSKLTEKTKKRIAATILAGSIAFSGLGIAACSSCNPDPNNTNPPIVTPGGDNGETQTPGGNGGSQTPGENGGNTNGGSTTPDYSKYSQILQNVLTDRYYANLIEMDHSSYKGYGSRNSYQNAQFNAIPFGFIEDEGFDISKIKNGLLETNVNLYTINKDLFIELRVETKASTNYFTHYLLKYTLTDKEIKELDSLFEPMSNVCGTRGTYYQAPFFVQELSYQKTPEVISKAHITQDSVDEIESYFNKKKYNSNTNKITYIKSVVLDSFTEITHHTFQTHMFADNAYTPDKINFKTKLNTITLETGGTCCSTINSINIFTDNDIHFYLSNENQEKYQSSTTDITLYSCENANFEIVNTTELDKELANSN